MKVQDDVQSNSSHAALQSGSIHCDMLTAIPEIQGVRAREREMEARQQEQVEAMQDREREMQMRLEHLEAILSMNLPNASIGDCRLRGGTSCSHPTS
ncbi:hypothetical protein Taro_021147 [Colocasia esculenta]|uniref:Uncharacterized protein n=1 Tax=Colocasia esculenta TaxID=4460 RepID=A0A843UY88_COLES|nr:hypothetical protein [Colocasia esculenta]